jgi:hypothetical protein
MTAPTVRGVVANLDDWLLELPLPLEAQRELLPDWQRLRDGTIVKRI